MENTHGYLMGNIDALWRTPEAELYGGKAGAKFLDAIDRNRAVDEEGKAIYERYMLSLDLDEELSEDREIIIPFSAAVMEEYARDMKKYARV